MDKKLLHLIKSGDFTIVYHDNDSCEIHKGQFDEYEDVPENKRPVYEFNYASSEGYCPEVVSLLVEALGGKSISV